MTCNSRARSRYSASRPAGAPSFRHMRRPCAWISRSRMPFCLSYSCLRIARRRLAPVRRPVIDADQVPGRNTHRARLAPRGRRRRLEAPRPPAARTHRMSPLDDIRRYHDELTAIRRDIHAHPELGLEEHRTADLVAAQAGGMGHRGASRRRRHRRGRRAALAATARPRSACAPTWTRCRSQEATGVAYASRNAGRDARLRP